MATLAAHQPANVRPQHWKDANPTKADLSHIPGEQGLPVVGNTLKMLADPVGFTKSMVEKYGRVYRNNAFGGTVVALIGADANELVLFDYKDKNGNVVKATAHADRNGLLDFVTGMTRWPREIRLVHGEDQAKRGLAESLRQLYQDSGQKCKIHTSP